MKYTNLRMRRFVAVLIGLFLLCTGLLKLMDPVGTMLIVTEYCKFFHIGFLIPAAKAIGINLALVESALGIALITGTLRRFAAWVTYVLLGFFTLVTLILWIKNPEMDCGCFGEAVHLTHAQSFWKNVILLLLSVFSFTPMRHLGHASARRRLAAFVGWASLIVVLVYCNTHIPPIDFTAFAPGSVLMNERDQAAGEDRSYQAAFVYEKDGRESSFALDNLPDSTWHFVRVDSLRREGVPDQPERPILSFRDAEGHYLDQLATQEQVVVFSVYEPGRVHWDLLQERCQAVREAGARPLLLSTLLPEGQQLNEEVYLADYKTLITLNRSNGGASYFDEGELIAKWGRRQFPADIHAVLAADPVDVSTRQSVKNRIQAQAFCVILGAVLILL